MRKAGNNFCLSILLPAVLLLLFCSASAMAATLDEYQGHISNARKAVAKMTDADYNSDGVIEVQEEQAALIKKYVPRTETVTWPGGAVETDNAWLHSDLDSLVAEEFETTRDAIIRRIDERLAAIEQKLSEIKAAQAGTHSKDEDKQKLAEILRRGEYQKPEANNESLFQRLKRQILEWLEKMFPAVKVEPQAAPAGLGTLARLLQILLYIGLAVGIGFLIYKFLPFITRRIRERESRSTGDRVILGERIADDLSSTDLFDEAERYARDGELRMAIRKGYIALLCELNDRKIIGLARHKTNRDYLRDLRSRQDLYENVRGLTGSFERNWYGSDASGEAEWQEFRSLYQRTVRGA